MKLSKYIAFGAIAAMVSCGTVEYIDRSTPPEPGPAPKNEIGKAESFTLDNGLKVFVVENHKLPRVSWQLSIDRGPTLEGDKSGLTGLMGDLMSQGTKNRSKDEINEEVDFIGGTLSTSSGGIYGSSLKKHTPALLAVMSDVLLNPTFPEDELEKIKTRTLSGLASEKTDANAIAGNVGSALRYGHDHPYGEQTTEETVKSITVEDCKAYYDRYFSPSISYLVIVGDIELEKAKTLAKKHFGSWKSKDVKKQEFSAPEPPKERRVAFVNKPGAVQSVINVTYPVVLKPGSEDAIAAQVMNNILGARGFGGRLMKNLREDKAYTYGAYSSLRTDRLVGSFTAFASVRNEVTDSAVSEFLYEMEEIVNSRADSASLERTKSQMAGNFARSLERPQTIARFALNTARYNLPEDYYSTYLDKLSKVTLQDVQRVAKKYIKPDNAIVLVVGNQDEVADKLGKFAGSGEVEFYDHHGYPAAQLKPVPEGITAESVIKKYIDALGGVDKLSKVSDIHTIREMEMAGMPMAINLDIKKKSGMIIMVAEAAGQVIQKQVYDGKAGKASGMTGNKEMTGAELEAFKSQAKIFPELDYLSGDYEMALLGIKSIDGKDAYKMEVIEKNGSRSYDYFDTESGLKVMSVSSQGEGDNAVTSTQEIEEYIEFDGIKFPKKFSQTAGPQSMTFTTKEVKMNTGISDEVFSL